MSTDGESAATGLRSEATRRAPFPLRLERMARAHAPSTAGVLAIGPVAASSTDSSGRQPIRPQAPLPHAGELRPRLAARVGLDSGDIRQRMVDRLRRGGLSDEAVLAAMARVPRHHFVDAGLVTQSYEDTSLPIGHGQTISKPSVVGRMIELLMQGRRARSSGSLGRVLEIGTGCGYQAAVLSELARSVVSVERLKPLHDKARELMAPTRGSNVRLVYADGLLGHPPNAPYDSIIAAACGDEVAPAWLAQLAVGGRLVAPVADAARGQVLVVIDRTEGGYHRCVQEGVRFVPLKSGVVR